MKKSEVIEQIKDSGVFLKFHVKKGLEVTGTGTLLASVRSTTVENMKNLNQKLLVTVNEAPGAMIVTPDIIEALSVNTVHVASSSDINKLKYSIIKFKWKPLDEFTLSLLFTYESMARSHAKTVSEKLKLEYFR